MILKIISDSSLLWFYHPRLGMLITHKPLTQFLMHNESSVTLALTDGEL